MAVYELAGRRQINDEESPSAETIWHVTGATSYGNAYGLLAVSLPTTFTFPSGRVAELDGVFAEELRDDEFFEFRCRYSAQPKPDFDQTEFSFEVAAHDEPVFQSLATVRYSPPGRFAPNYGGAIGVSGGGTPTGVSPLHAYSTFSITKHWAVASVTESYQNVIESLMGSISSTTFYGRAAGTVRFLGARGRQSGDKFPIEYSFGFRPNLSGLVFDSITGVSANGWDIVEPIYQRQIDTVAKRPVWRPIGVYVHRIHALSTFGGLNV